MKRARMMALLVVAACAFSAIAVASALAEPPELQAKNKKTEKWEPLTKPVKFTESSGNVELRSAASDVLCAASSGKGKLTGPKTLTVKTVYTSCQELPSKATCQSGKKAGEIKPGKAEGTLVYASANPGEPLTVALSTPTMISYTCGSTKFTLKGLVLGAVTPTEVPTSELEVTYGELAETEPGCGKQELKLIQGLAPCVHLVVQAGAGPEEPAWMKKDDKKEAAGHVTLVK
jgi:hypothetical protein